MSYRIPLAVPDVGLLEEQAVAAAMRSGWIAPAGPDLTAFEEELAMRTDRAHAVAVATGTAALHLALIAAGVREGDIVPCATLTFAATANAITYVGATPVFIDCDDSGTMDVGQLHEALRLHTASGRRIGAIVPVDLYGKVADYASIDDLASRYQVPVVSDAAESLGAHRGGRPAGSFGSLAALSFNGNKIVTTSNGGAVLTDDADVAARIRYLSTQAREPVRHYEHEEIGYNYRLSNVLAALGRAQLSRLDEIVEVKRSHRRAYRSMCARLPGIAVLGGEDSGDNCWLTAVTVDPRRSGITAEKLMDALDGQGIETRPVFKPMHAQPIFSDAERFPRYLRGVSDRMFSDGLVLPSGTGLTPTERDVVVASVEAAVRDRVTVSAAS